MFKELHLVLPEEAWGGAMQMALDEVLLRKAELPLLRIYRWQTPCVTFGYFQKITEVQGAYPESVLVRRRTGGGMVEHGQDLTFSLIIPKGESAAALSPALFYRELHRKLAQVLAAFGKSDLLLAGEGEIKEGPACFQAPARDDLLRGGKKILGGAQCRSAGALLYQGSLLETPQGELKAFLRSFAGTLAEKYSEVILPEVIVEEATALANSRYASAAWNERR